MVAVDGWRLGCEAHDAMLTPGESAAVSAAWGAGDAELEAVVGPIIARVMAATREGEAGALVQTASADPGAQPDAPRVAAGAHRCDAADGGAAGVGVRCDERGCGVRPGFRCACPRCSREPDDEAFWSCTGHRADVGAKHERVRGRRAEWVAVPVEPAE